MFVVYPGQCRTVVTVVLGDGIICSVFLYAESLSISCSIYTGSFSLRAVDGLALDEHGFIQVNSFLQVYTILAVG